MVKGPGDGYRSPPPQCHSGVGSKEQKPACCENPTSMAPLVSYQSIHKEAFRDLPNFIVTCSTWMSISVTANRSTLSDWAVGPVLGGGNNQPPEPGLRQQPREPVPAGLDGLDLEPDGPTFDQKERKPALRMRHHCCVHPFGLADW